MGLISKALGGGIVLQIGDLQKVFGVGPLSVHLRMVCHRVLVQSWFPMTPDVAAHEALPTPVVPHETPGRGSASRASEGGTCLFLEECMSAGEEVAETTVHTLAPRDCCGVVDECKSWYQYVYEKTPDWQERPDLLRLYKIASARVHFARTRATSVDIRGTSHMAGHVTCTKRAHGYLSAGSSLILLLHA